jgi:D-methionine transport system permease protein
MSETMLSLLLNATGETVYMVSISSLLAIVFGVPLGVLLFVTRAGSLAPNDYLYRLIDIVINITRAIPFIILMVALIPLTRLLVQTSIGTNAAIVPLTIAAIPFFARVIDNALQEVSKGLLEASIAMGATPIQTVQKVLLPEAWPAIIKGVTLMLINLIGYSAMAGAVGGGGLGDVAIRYGYQRFNPSVMVITIVIILSMVQLLQWAGDSIIRHISRKRGL